MEPEDEAVHLHEQKQRLHHQPGEDAGEARYRLCRNEGHRGKGRKGPVCRHEEAGADRRRGRGAAQRILLRQPEMAGRSDDQLPHHPEARKASG